MKADKYVSAIVRKIKCDGNKKKDIKNQLLTDINMRLNQGEKLEDVIAQMGSVKEIADSFNENISDAEKKRYSRNRVFKIVIACVVIFALLLCLVYWILPKSVNIENSKYFDANEVENAMKNTVELLDASDYAALKENAIPQMQSLLDADTMEAVKNQVSDNWGERNRFDNVYMVEMIQGNTHFAVGEITVSYENISVTYRLTYDVDMKLAGVYMR